MVGETIRTFLAVDISDAVRHEMQRLIDTLSASISGVRWVKPHNIHLTLKFFGEIEPELIEAISRALAALTPHPQSFQVNAAGMGMFPNTRKPRVIWIGLGGAVAQLIKLQASIESALEAVGIPRDPKSFNPHLTLGRIKDSRSVRGLQTLELNPGTPDLGSWNITGMHLFKSVLTPSGPLYSVMKSFAFNAPDCQDNSGE